MAEDESAARPQSANATMGLAMGAAAREVPPEDMRAFVRERTRLAQLQSQSLIEQNAFEMSHLRFRRFGDYARFALELGGIFVVLLIVSGLIAMVWRATQDHDLVVDPFSVPDDVAQSGLTGTVLAGRVLDRLGEMQADTFSMSQGAGTYRRNDSAPVRIEIPSTGISIGELDAYLRQWLGHESAVVGALTHTPKGYALTIRYGDKPGATVEGGDLDGLIGPAAEQLYKAAKPLRYADYLSTQRRYREAEAIIVPLAARGTPPERALAYLSWATMFYAEGDPYGEMEKSAAATRLDPTNASAWYELDAGAYNAGHRETALQAEKAVMALIKAGKARDLDPDTAASLPLIIAADLATDRGDSAGAIAQCQGTAGVTEVLDCGPVFMAGYEAANHNIAELRRSASLLPATLRDGKPNSGLFDVQSRIAAAAGDWPAAIVWLKKEDAALAAEPGQLWRRERELWPVLAIDMARVGDFAGAEALIARTAVDCDLCVDARGQIAALKGDWTAAQRWFARVSARAPSIPYFDTDWGEALLRKGDAAAAIAKFESANQKGPHFADPLEMWGEALMAKNRSDLALAKFAEADKYVPHWGRLHLKWGEALYWSGDKEGARRQFAIASGLDLCASDKAALAHMGNLHG